jgi:hypothetical protein
MVVISNFLFFFKVVQLVWACGCCVFNEVNDWLHHVCQAQQEMGCFFVYSLYVNYNGFLELEVPKAIFIFYF